MDFEIQSLWLFYDNTPRDTLIRFKSSMLTTSKSFTLLTVFFSHSRKLFFWQYSLHWFDNALGKKSWSERVLADFSFYYVLQSVLYDIGTVASFVSPLLSTITTFRSCTIASLYIRVLLILAEIFTTFLVPSTLYSFLWLRATRVIWPIPVLKVQNGICFRIWIKGFAFVINLLSYWHNSSGHVFLLPMLLCLSCFVPSGWRALYHILFQQRLLPTKILLAIGLFFTCYGNPVSP